MSDATSTDQVVPAQSEQAEPTKQNDAVQARINELTAEKYALAEQVKQQTQLVAELIRKTTERPAVQEQAPALPEGVDPGVAGWLVAQMKAEREAMQKNTQQMFWQIQHQLDQSQVSAQYAGLPPEVTKAAAERLTVLKQQYGPSATMEDAVNIELGKYTRKQAQTGRANAYNGMSPAISQQSHMPNVGGGVQQQSASLVPPTQDPNWDRYTLAEQNQKITEYEKKGGTLF